MNNFRRIEPIEYLVILWFLFMAFYLGSLAWSLGSYTVDLMHIQKAEKLCVNEFVAEGYEPKDIIVNNGICYLKAPN